jgi:hypothetical protein
MHATNATHGLGRFCVARAEHEDAEQLDQDGRHYGDRPIRIKDPHDRGIDTLLTAIGRDRVFLDLGDVFLGRIRARW